MLRLCVSQSRWLDTEVYGFFLLVSAVWIGLLCEVPLNLRFGTCRLDFGTFLEHFRFLLLARVQGFAPESAWTPAFARQTQDYLKGKLVWQVNW